MASAFLAFLVCFCSYNASAQTFDTSTGAPTIVEHNISDDGYAQVNLGFSFPFYGNTYTTSYMHSNGVVQFVNPTTSWCCNGINLDTNSTLSSSYNYAIAVLWTDLIDNSTEGRFYTQGNENYQRYQWNNISEYYNSNRNTVGLEIRPDGSFDMYHQMINIQNHSLTIGVIGDATQGEWTQYQYTNTGGTLYNFGSSTSDDRVTGWSATNNVYSYSDGTSGTASAADPCDSDPLYSENCSGYAQAYYNQQCELDALYDSGCLGYADAYFSQQCSLDALYNEDCPGYEQAYFNQQCSLDPLYDEQCDGYEQAYYELQCSLDALYDSGCDGYEQAYYDQQCTSNSLYDSGCPGYDNAYYDQQCGIDPLYDSGCSGYESAYLDQQCTADPLYDNTCPGYETAFYTQQCTADPLYDSGCPGYEQAIIDQNCSIDPLFSPTCDGYSTALAESTETETVGVVEEEIATIEEELQVVEEVEELVSAIETEEIAVSVVEVEGVPSVTTMIPEVPVVDVATVTLTERIESVAAETREVEQQKVETEQKAAVAEVEKEVEKEIAAVEPKSEVVEKPIAKETKEKKVAEKKEEKKEEKSEKKEEKPKKKVAKKDTKKKVSKRQRIKKAIEKRVASLAERMGESTALEEQKQVQINILAMMGYVPGFNSYTGTQLQDNQFYEQRQLPGGEISDNRFISRFLMNDERFNEMEQSQYRRRVIGK